MSNCSFSTTPSLNPLDFFFASIKNECGVGSELRREGIAGLVEKHYHHEISYELVRDSTSSVEHMSERFRCP